MRIIILYILFLWLPGRLLAQESLPEKTTLTLKEATSDSLKFIASQNAAYYWVELNRDSLLYYVNECISLAQKHGQKLEEAWGLASRGYCLTGMGEYSQALTNFLKAFVLLGDQRNDSQRWLPPGETGRHRRLYYSSYTHHIYAILMGSVKNHEEAIRHFREAKRIAQEIDVPRGVIWADMNLGYYYQLLDKPDSALAFSNQAIRLASITPGETKYLGFIYSTLGHIWLTKGDTTKAIQLFHDAIRQAGTHKNQVALVQAYGSLARLYLDQKQKDSCIWYARKAHDNAPVIGKSATNVSYMGGIYSNLHRSYLLNNQPDSALKYADLALQTMDTTTKKEIKSLAEFQKTSLSEQLRLQNLEKEQVVYQSKVRTNTLFGGLGVFLFIAALLYRNNRKKQKTNKILEQTLTDLKSTQAQLIQSEKMASMGELTAGIAHEIQNPLNFVNNFSEINNELLVEMKSEMENGDLVNAKAIADDVIANEEKISHHGKRADAIVKGMLQHSRTSSGQKEPTDLNALCDEYLRLSYHGLRAKDKTFNAKFETDFDTSIGKLNVVPQDIGRAILNLINNAFYAVSEKKKSFGQSDYEPTVTVTTRKSGAKVEIRVRDNGNGIPQNVMDKIFQPFFTTKPTGQGTGLGLSLSYDIVKAHGGELTVETNKGEGSKFVINIPS